MHLPIKANKGRQAGKAALTALVTAFAFHVADAAYAQENSNLPPVSPTPPALSPAPALPQQITPGPEPRSPAPFNFQQFNTPPNATQPLPLAPPSANDDRSDPYIKGKNLIRQATQLISAGQLDAAVGLLQKSMDYRRVDPTPQFLLGLIYDQTGNTQAALSNYTLSVKKATALGMDSSQLRINLGNTLVKLNYLKEAEFDYRRAIEIDDKNDVAHLNLGRLLLFKGDNAGAFQELKRAHELMATDPNLPLYEALALKGMGNAEESRLQLQEFLERAKGINSDPRVINMAEKLLAGMK